MTPEDRRDLIERLKNPDHAYLEAQLGDAFADACKDPKGAIGACLQALPPKLRQLGGKKLLDCGVGMAAEVGIHVADLLTEAKTIKPGDGG